jgi:hypothetical protein
MTQVISSKKGHSVPTVMMMSTPLEAAVLAALKKSLGIQMKDYSDMPDSIVMGIINQLTDAATRGDRI